MKRKISKPQYTFLENEFNFLQQRGIMEPEDARDILALYEPRGSANFVRVLLVFGAILIGIGILSFIAGNWAGLTPFFKFGLIVIAFILFYLAGYKLEENYEKTARSMYYIGAAIYGAGIFLIGQSFHLQHTVYTDFLLWAIGILPLAYYLRDQLVAVFASAFLIIYSFSAFSADGITPYWLLLLIPALFWMNEKRLGRKGSIFIMGVLLATAFVVNLLESFGVDEWISILLVFAGGVLLALFPFKQYKPESYWIGSILFGITGIMLTFPFSWRELAIENTAPYVFTALFVILLIYFLKKDSLPAILITCALIYRYYADITYDFMPKSLFFIIGGLLLIGFGFWFEKSRRETVKRHEE
ncbi:DUF2157 domain-containing protein [Sporosarcina sp. GW1-11]|uniref:DUF2157 domain-containing protein n=1 Tax=Sporosarcina sp. GW1-11 TaxID=2899126 RepID=UPI00294BB6A5|nr:DUF2157 domain-containing protein [Sporosarcina sp. GW1-11]MDV6377824.1 DUF2157 domain-containing protein [Sporosarcina sp. GW1-11]